MLYIGTKIVVIGSNVKRKAGPRIGSIGFIVDIMTNKRMTLLGNNLVCDAYILFIQYGFQKQQRYELKRVMVAIPRLENWPCDIDKVLTKTVKSVKTDASIRLPLLMICPVTQFNDKDLQHKVHSHLLNGTMRYKLQNVAYVQNSKRFPNTERLHATLPEGAKTFLRVSTVGINPNALNILLSKVFEKDKYVLREVLELVLKLDALRNITEKQSKAPIGPKGNDIIFNSLFKPYEFRRCIIESGKYAPKELFAFCVQLSNSLIIEGIKVVNKHV